MDAPPAQENCLAFVRVAGFLEAIGLNAARVLEADTENGFLLLSDLGREEYLGVLGQDPAAAPRLYADAIDALLSMQRRGAAYQSHLPPYDETSLQFELALFRDWLCDAHLKLVFSKCDERNWRACCAVLAENALRQPQVFVHRDYHSRNLMVNLQRNPGVLDFQDAVEGPFTYDLVSLLKDCYIRWPAVRVREWALGFYASLDASTHELVDEKQFLRYFELMGVQRHLKAAGIFCRLNHRDEKPLYLADVPMALDYIVELAPDYEELRFLTQLIEERILPVWSEKR